MLPLYLFQNLLLFFASGIPAQASTPPSGFDMIGGHNREKVFALRYCADYMMWKESVTFME
jgi:hypothetical protein